jgi:hypothetical protein
MKQVTGKTFNGQRVVLDGKSFTGCHFSKCRLIIEGEALFQMQDCRIDEDCEFSVEGRGLITLNVLKLMLHSGGWLSRVAVNVLHAIQQPPKAAAARPPQVQQPQVQQPQVQQPQGQPPQG